MAIPWAMISNGAQDKIPFTRYLTPLLVLTTVLDKIVYSLAECKDGIVPRSMDFGSREYDAQFIELEFADVGSSIVSIPRHPRSTKTE
jgi:hypothetical protein